MPDPFIDQQDLVDYIGIGGTADPGMLIAVDAACDICRDIAEQDFNAATTTVTLDGTGTDAILLPHLPANTVGTVTVNGGTVTDYLLKDNGVLIRGTVDPDSPDWWTQAYDPLPTPRWPEGRQNIVVTYQHGYADADIPRSIRMVALSIAARLVIQGPASQETVGDNQIRYSVASTDLTNGERAILRKHKR